MNPTQFYKKFSKFGLVGHLLAASHYAAQNMAKVSGKVMTKKRTGDIVTKKDKVSQNSIQKYFKQVGISALVNGEEGIGKVKNPQYLVLLDALEGTQNALNNLAYGINIAIAPYKTCLRVKDLEAAAVCNLRSGTFYAAGKGEKPFKIQNGEEKEIIRKQTDVYECPLSTAYTTDLLQRLRQGAFIEIFFEVLGNQPRSIDATGTRLVALLEGDIRAYGDARNATKCWDVLPSAFILRQEGFKVTDMIGLEFSESIFYDERCPRNNGLNRRIGENFIVANSEDHNRLLFGKGDSVWRRITEEVTRPLDEVFFSSCIPGSAPTKEQEFYRFGRMIAQALQHNIDEKKGIYRGLHHDNVVEIVKKVRDKFVDIIPKKSFPNRKPLHLMKFDHMLSWMTDYDFGLDPEYVAKLGEIFV